jgi:hypothetical protein
VSASRIARRLVAALFLGLCAAATAAGPTAVRVIDWMLPVPANWTPQVPSSAMRVAQFTIATEGGHADAAVFYFGRGSGGSVEDNTARWASQFLDADGKPAKPRTERGVAGGMPLTWVALDGRYARGVGTGPQGEARPRQSLRVAVIETDRGNLFFQLWGDEAAIARQYPVMRTIVAKIQRGP